MLTQQTGRYLFKTFRSILANPDADIPSQVGTAASYIKRYIKDPKATAPFKYAGDLSSPQFFIGSLPSSLFFFALSKLTHILP
jgi:acyl-CoA oxidase